MLKCRFWEFLGIFLVNFLYAPPPRPFIATLIFRQMETVKVGHMPCMFHSHLTCNSQKVLKNSPKKLILWLVFGIFFNSPFYALRVMSQFLAKWKVSWRYKILESFISMTFVVAKLLIFKWFCRTRKVDFRLHLGGFLSITPPNTVEFFWYWMSDAMQHKVLYVILFCMQSQKLQEKKPKNQRFGFFRGFLATLSYALWVTP